MAVDVGRGDAAPVLAPGARWVTWVTRPAVPPHAAAGPHDRLILADAGLAGLAAAAGWPADRVRVGGVRRSCRRATAAVAVARADRRHGADRPARRRPRLLQPSAAVGGDRGRTARRPARGDGRPRPTWPTGPSGPASRRTSSTCRCSSTGSSCRRTPKGWPGCWSRPACRSACGGGMDRPAGVSSARGRAGVGRCRVPDRRRRQHRAGPTRRPGRTWHPDRGLRPARLLAADRHVAAFRVAARRPRLAIRRHPAAAERRADAWHVGDSRACATAASRLGPPMRGGRRHRRRSMRRHACRGRFDRSDG